MAPFGMLRKHFWFIGLLKSDSNRVSLLNLVFIGFFINFFLTSFWFFTFTARTFVEHSKSFYYMISSLLALSWYSVYCFQRSEYTEMYADLDATIDERIQNPVIERIYRKINKKVDFLSEKIYVIVMQMEMPFFAISPMVLTVWKYISSEHSNVAFQQIYPATYPFNWKTPFGYLMCYLLQTPSVLATAELFVWTLMSAIGFSLFLTTFVLDIEENLHSLNDEIIDAEKEILNADQRIGMATKVFSIIKFHSEAHQFANHFSATNSAIIFTYILFFVISSSSAILQVTILLAAREYIEILQTLIPATVDVFWLYLFCHFGSYVTERFEDIGNEMYQLNWYLLPMNIQKNVPMMLSLAQKNVYLEASDGTRCTRETFKKMMNTTCSYFMVLRRFNF